MKYSLLITDVDNTLLDWQRLWFETFSAMIDRVLAISGVDEDLLPPFPALDELFEEQGDEHADDDDRDFLGELGPAVKPLR